MVVPESRRELLALFVLGQLSNVAVITELDRLKMRTKAPLYTLPGLPVVE